MPRAGAPANAVIGRNRLHMANGEMGVDRPVVGDLRVASLPPDVINPYIRLFYDACKPLGVRLVTGLEPNDASLNRLGPQLDAIHFHWPELYWRLRGPTPLNRLHGLAGFWTFLRLAKRLGLRIIWTVHNLEPHEDANGIDRLGYALLARYADLRICHGEWARNEIRKRQRFAQGALIAIPFGNYDHVYPAPESRDHVRQRLGIATDRRVLLCFGEVRWYKGFQHAIAALEWLDERYTLLVAGRSWDTSLTERLSRQGEAVGRVKLQLELLSDQSLVNVIHASDCVLLPYTKVTGSAALLMALTCGRGAVCADLPFFREVLAPEPQAAVIASTDPASIARGVERFFAGDPAERHAAARRLAQQYDWSRAVLPLAPWLRQVRGEARSYGPSISGHARS